MGSLHSGDLQVPRTELVPELFNLIALRKQPFLAIVVPCPTLNNAPGIILDF
jgi:hypothetical protein